MHSAGDFRQTSRFTSWLYAIARNLCIDTLRKEGHRRHRSLDEPVQGANGGGATLGDHTADRGAEVERGAMAGQVRDRLLSALAALPEEQREVFLLREVSNLPFKEIADVVGAPENTVKSRMRYALERLQITLREFEDYARALR